MSRRGHEHSYSLNHKFKKYPLTYYSRYCTFVMVAAISWFSINCRAFRTVDRKPQDRNTIVRNPISEVGDN